MIESKEILINEYVNALRMNSASVFIGAGFSYNLVHLDWDKLIKQPLLEEIGLTQDSALSNPKIAQYYMNTTGKSLEEFKKEVAVHFITEKFEYKHELLARLPIRNYWTTNYDTIIENALKYVRKTFDIKNDNVSFANIYDSRNSIVYKVHGDINTYKDIIITEDDYDAFEQTHPNFYTALEHELSLNTMLFIGYSFNDPDITKKLKLKNDGNLVKHFFIIKKEQQVDKQREQELFLKDIERYSIQSLYIDEYNEVKEIVEAIYKQYMSYKVLISGSAHAYTEYGSDEEARDLIYSLGYHLVDMDKGHGIKIINGNGFGIGPVLYEGVAEAAAINDLDMADYLKLYPFPKKYYSQHIKTKSLESIYNPYREKMIHQCGIAFFLFGNKKNANGEIINADGVKKEFDIAVEQKKYVFPIGATGYQAKELADLVLSNFEYYNGDMLSLKELLKQLNTPRLPKDEIINIVLTIIDILAFRPKSK